MNKHTIAGRVRKEKRNKKNDRQIQNCCFFLRRETNGAKLKLDTFDDFDKDFQYNPNMGKNLKPKFLSDFFNAKNQRANLKTLE